MERFAPGQLAAPGLLAALILSGCGSKAVAPSLHPVSGVWVGEANGAPFRMEIAGTASGGIAGTVMVQWGDDKPDTISVHCGGLVGSDSLFLDLTSVSPPLGCSVHLEGRFLTENEAAGEFSGRCAHDPETFRTTWFARRQEGPAGGDEPPVLGQAFRIRVGQEVLLPREGLAVRFLSVPFDSRCPEDVLCVWQGSAQLQLEARRQGYETARLELETCCAEERSAEYAGYVIEVVGLHPCPRSDRVIDPGEYIAMLVVRKTG